MKQRDKEEIYKFTPIFNTGSVLVVEMRNQPPIMHCLKRIESLLVVMKFRFLISMMCLNILS